MPRFAPDQTPRRYAPDLPIEPRHMAVDVDLDILGRKAGVGVRIDCVCNQDGARTLRLDAVGFLGLTASSGDGEELSWSYDGRTLQVAWLKAGSRGQKRTVLIRYEVVEPIGGLYFSQPDEAYPDQPTLVCTDHETERARYWLACIDHPAVRTTWTWRISCDARFEIEAGGKRVEERVEEDRRHVRFELEQRCPSYLAAFVAGALRRVEFESVDGIELAALSGHNVAEEDLRRGLGDIPSMMRWAQRRLETDFPYPKYFQFAAPGVGGAMENITLTSWDDIHIAEAERAAEWDRVTKRVNLHELAHSWFGDTVVCRDYEHAWLKESWATYLETCWLEDEAGPEEATYARYQHAERYFGEARTRYTRPIQTKRYVGSWDMYDAHLYPGGARRLHMLRHKLGETAFWGGVREYLATYSEQTVETDQFRRTMEEQCGRNLVPFFDQWFRSPGHPRLSVSFAWSPADKVGTFELKQTQVSKEHGVGLFDIEVTLAWRTGETWDRTTASFDGSRHIVRIPMPEDPTALRVDPDEVLLAEVELDAGAPRWRNMIALEGDVVGRIRAGRALAGLGGHANFTTLQQAYAVEPFWGVREAWAKAVATCKLPRAAACLAAWLEDEKHPAVLMTLTAQAREFRNPRIATALRDALAGQRLGPFARGAAWESLGAQRDEGDLESLDGALRVTQGRGLEAAGALRGLGRSRNEGALEALVRASEPGVVTQAARPAAAQGLGLLAAWAQPATSKRICAHLLELLRDPDPRVRWSAATEVASLAPGGSAEHLEAMRATMPHQYKRRLDLLVEKARGAGGSNATDANARREVEALRESALKLRARVEDLESRTREDGG